MFLKIPENITKVCVREEREDTYKSAYDFGSYMHSLLLEPDKTDDEFAVFEGATRRGKRRFKSNNEGKTIITASQAQQALDLYNLYHEHLDTQD